MSAASRDNYARTGWKGGRKPPPVNDILHDWYGDDRAVREIAARLPGGVSLRNAVKSLIEKAVGEEEIELMKLKSAWKKAVGQQIAAISEPVRLKNHLLYVAVDHSAWMMELNNPQTKKKILERLSEHAGKREICRDIRLVPSGT